MSDSLAIAAVGVIGVVLGAGSILAFRFSERSQSAVPEQQEPVVPPGVNAVLSALRSSALVIAPDDTVLKATAPAHALGLVRGNRLVVQELLDLVRQVRRDGESREADLTIAQPFGRPPTYVAARLAPLGSRLVLALVEDQTRERRVEAIRRDFVANVSHELKTPIGALALLAEAVGEAADDPDAVRRFSHRMQKESERLSRLVQQIIELSRLQGDDPIDAAMAVSLDDVVDAAIDRSRVDAQTKSIELSRAGETGVTIVGNGAQIELALGNLVENAITYSAEGTHVVVSVKASDEGAELTVTDQGVGIPQHELDRIFERFYRIDPARSRSTGGTGLGLSIVKHVAASHGGEVRVWSVEGEGSSFTMRLPSRADEMLQTTVATGEDQQDQQDQGGQSDQPRKEPEEATP
ncbi:MAG: two-component sensor histidine kinase [Propionibacteriales bacterium]|nr:two-component sensor histidine kinase [Propionibacteriales bacterium]